MTPSARDATERSAPGALSAKHVVGEPRHVVILAVPRTSLLEVAGPMEVFSLVAVKLREAGRTRARDYRMHLVSAVPGPLEPGIAGVRLETECHYADYDGPIDTLLIVGGLDVWEDRADPALRDWIVRRATEARRYGSICTGAFLLAESGLLDGQHVTTHWYFCERLAREYPRLLVDPDPIFIRDGPLWTAAGVTAGIDVALAMVEEDVGIDIAARVARGLVLYVRRPGVQAQMNRSLVVQASGRLPFRELPLWIIEHLDQILTVEALASRVGMSVRNFTRRFTHDFQVSPARFVAEVRAETALRMLSDGDATREAIAMACGLGSVDSLERAVAAYRRRGATYHFAAAIEG